MNGRRALVCVLLFVLLYAALIAQAETTPENDTIIDIVDGVLLVQGHQIELAKEIKKPVLLDTVDGNVRLRVSTSQGKEMEILLGNVAVSITERAYPYIMVTPQPSPTAPPTRIPETKCRYCGVSMKEHVCPRCNKRYCQHDDFACSYKNNPAPTPFSTTDADGKVVKFYIAPDGKSYAGIPLNASTSKYSEWSPGYEYRDTHATPVPTATPEFDW